MTDEKALKAIETLESIKQTFVRAEALVIENGGKLSKDLKEKFELLINELGSFQESFKRYIETGTTHE